MARLCPCVVFFFLHVYLTPVYITHTHIQESRQAVAGRAEGHGCGCVCVCVTCGVRYQCSKWNGMVTGDLYGNDDFFSIFVVAEMVLFFPLQIWAFDFGLE